MVDIFRSAALSYSRLLDPLVSLGDPDMPVYSSHLLRYDDMHVGARIRQERVGRNLTLKQLASRANLSAAWLSEIENGRHVIDLAQTFAIARALGLPPAGLLPPDLRIPYQLSREPEVMSRPPGRVQCGNMGQKAQVQRKSEFWPLADLFIARHLEPQLGRIPPVADPTLQFCYHHEEEFVFVLRGTIELRIQTPEGLCREEIGRGDSLCFRSDFPHSLRSLEDQPAETIHVFAAGAVPNGTGFEWMTHPQTGYIEDASAGDALRQVGERLRALRDVHGWSRDQVAGLVGLTIRQLERIELGERGVPLNTLLSLARAFGRPLQEILGQPPDAGPYYVIQPAATINQVPTRRRRTPVEKPNAPPSKTCQPLSLGFPSRCMFPYLLRILDVDADTLTLHEHHGQEFIYLLEGELEIVTYAGDERVSEVLRPGDSCYLDSTVPHLLRGHSRNPFSQTCAEVLDVFWSPLGERYLFEE
jgi:transcriptional regulator with XRE-family HTH domain